MALANGCSSGGDRREAVARHRSMVQQELTQLEAECRQKKVRLVYDDLRGEGGLCRVRSEFYVIVNRRLSPERRVRLIRSCLERLRREQSSSLSQTALTIEQSMEARVSSVESTSVSSSSSVGHHRQGQCTS